MSGFSKIKVETQDEGQVLRLTLNAPKANVLDRQMMTELLQAVQQASKSEVKALMFDAEGPHFSFGASVPEHQKEQVADMLETFSDLLKALIDISLPMFAVVKGQCLGGGLELASFCHWIFAAEDAMFGQPEIKLGVFAPFASLILPHRIGQSAADDLNLSGRSITADEAQRIGLVHSVSKQPAKEAHGYIEQHILSRSAASLRMATKAARFEMNRTFLTHLDAMNELYSQELMATEDANEGIAAFLEKRKPVWKNR